MDTAVHLEHLDRDGALLADAAERAGLAARVPATRWNVRNLLTHTGGIHRWAADIVGNARANGDTPAGRSVGKGPAGDQLLPWFRTGHVALVTALRAAPADLRCFTFLPADSPRAFWSRRQAHETAIHRADAQAAAGDVPEFDREFAQDGIAEMLLGFAARKSNAIARTATIALMPSDGGPSWAIELGGERIQAAASPPASADVTLSGSATELYLWLWNRPARVQLDGDASVAKLWREVRVRWS